MRRVPVHSVTSLLKRGSRSLDGPACLPACLQVARSHTCERPLYLRFKRGPFYVVVTLHLIVFLSRSLSRRRRPSATYLATSLFAPSRSPCHAIAHALVIFSVFLFTSSPLPSPSPPPPLPSSSPVTPFYFPRSPFSGHVVIYSFNSAARGLPRIEYHVYLMARI